MSKPRNLKPAMALAIFASLLVLITVALVAHSPGGKPWAPGPLDAPVKKHLV